MIFVTFHEAGTQCVTLVSQRGHGVGTLHASMFLLACLPIPGEIQGGQWMLMVSLFPSSCCQSQNVRRDGAANSFM